MTTSTATQVRAIIRCAAMRSAPLVKGSTLKVYPGLSHSMCTINEDLINADLLAFIRSES
jgi:non-heme chloroperoxidase